MKLKLLVQIIISVAVIVLLLLHVVDIREVGRLLQGFPLSYALLAVLVVTLDRALMTYKWQVLLRAQGHDLGLLPGMTIYCASQVWGSALPATVGADAVRAVLVARRGIRGTDVVASIVVERVVGFVCALALAFVCLILLRTLGVLDARYDILVLAAAGMFLGVLALVLASLSSALAGRLMALVPQRLQQSKPMRVLGELGRAYRSLGGARATIARFIGLTSLEQLFGILVPWTIAEGLGLDVNPLVLLGAFPIAMLVSRLPVSLDGIGVFEALFIGLMLLAGISGEAAFAIALLGRVLQLIAWLPWWFAQVLRLGSARPPVTPAA